MMMQKQIALAAAMSLLALLMPTTQADDEQEYVLEGSTSSPAWVYAGNHVFAYTTEDTIQIDYKLHVKFTPEGRQVTDGDLQIQGGTGEAECRGIDHDVEGRINDLFIAPLDLNGFGYIPCKQLFIGLEPVSFDSSGDTCRLTGNLAGWNEAKSHWKHIKLGGELPC